MYGDFYIPQDWQQWSLNRLLGQSQTDAVALVQRKIGPKTDFSYIKMINISGGQDAESVQSQIEDLTEEVKIRNNNLVRYEDFIIKENEGYQFFARMEYVQSLSDLLERYGKLSEADVIRLGIDMCKALIQLKSKNIVHGHIHPGNIFCDVDGNFKLGGVGTLGRLDYLISGSMSDLETYFTAPEATNSPVRNNLTDIYSVGSVLYFLLNNNKPPFVDQNFSQLSYKDKEDYINGKMSGAQFPSPVNCKNEYLKNIISTACEFAPDRRWKNPEAMKNALENILEEENSKNKNSFEIPAAQMPSSNFYSGNDTFENNGFNGQNNVNPPYQPNTPPVNNNFGGGYVPNNNTYANNPAANKSLNKGNKKLAVLVSSVSGAAVAVIIAVLLFVYPGFLSGKDNYPVNSTNIVNRQDNTDDNDFMEEKTEEKTTKTEKVYVPNVTDMKESDAKETLADEGFDVDIEYDYSDDVDKNRVISQSPKGGDKAEEGSTVTLVVSKGTESKPSPEYYSQKIEVETSGTYATMELFQWNGKEWESLFYTANVRIGENGASYDYGEGKKTTPKGTFDIGFCYGLTQPETGLKFKQLTTSSVFVDDPDSQYYNMLVDRYVLSGDVSYENTYDQFANKNYYSTCIFIEHNGDGETVGTASPNMGSVITICGKNGNMNSTFGCIDITTNDMYYLLRYLDEEQNPVIIIS